MQSVARIALSVPEAAFATGVSRSHIYLAIKDNSLKSSKLSGRRVIRVADLDAWVLGAQEVRK